MAMSPFEFGCMQVNFRVDKSLCKSPASVVPKFSKQAGHTCSLFSSNSLVLGFR